MNIEVGVYQNIISKAIAEKLANYPDYDYYIKREAMDSGNSHELFADYLSNIIGNILKDCFTMEKGPDTIGKQVRVINRILQFIENEWQTENIDTSQDIIREEDCQELLRGIYSKMGLTDAQVREKAKLHPLSGYRSSNLFTGNGELNMDEELRRDIQTSDHIDLVVSFIKFEGLRLLYDSLKNFVSREGTTLRILTTTYMGATDPKAVQRLYELSQLGNVQIKASFNTNQERLHAKAYIFHRNNGMDTAYIGSSNMSRSALTKGLEWNIRITSVENEHIIAKTTATFDNYWNSEDFEPIASEEDLERFTNAIKRIKERSDNTIIPIMRFERKTHQIKVLEKLQYEREVLGHYKNLVIAATGTGKTVMCAFDYKDFNKKLLESEHRSARLLFVVHREKILKQALSTFRSVMVDNTFGDYWSGNHQPNARTNMSQLFVTIQTFNSHKEEFTRLGEEYYDYIVIDEAHHSQAGSYRSLFNLFTPQIFMGLTATPERMDGQEIKSDFDNRFAAEIRLQEALNQQLLAPFDYFCVSDDSVNLSEVACRGDKYDNEQLTRLYVNNDRRFEIIEQALDRYLSQPRSCKAICFCTGIEHANYMANKFIEKSYKARAITSRNSTELDSAAAQLARGEINYLCVADILNEGIDIPEIDTVLFLRPTESLTIFLQQLGRGLRVADGKTCLTVLDFVAQANKTYNYESRFRALIGRTQRSIKDEVKNGFTFLPRGCSITMEHMAQEWVLQNLQNAIFNLKRLCNEVKHFTQNTGKELTLENFLDNFSLDWRLLSKTPGSWSRLKTKAGVSVEGFDPDSKYIQLVEGGLARLFHTNSHEYLAYLNRLLDNNMKQLTDATQREKKFIKLLYYTIFLDDIIKINKNYNQQFGNIEDAICSLNYMVWFKEEMRFIVKHRLADLSKTTQWIQIDDATEIELYGCYSADEIHLMLEDKPGRWQVLGTQYNYEKQFAMVFVTLNKSDRDYTPTTRYEDYAISADQFHWQSMNRVRIDSEEGQRIIQQQQNGWRYLLFVRDNKQDEYGITNGYYCLGFMNFNSSHSEMPINVVWDMQNPIPGFILESAKAV